jgi:hypothetical protein
MHNTDAMQARRYPNLANESGMRLETTRYIDGADPAMLIVKVRPMQAAVLPLQLWRRLRFSDRVNHRLISSYLLLTFVRPA